VTAPTGRQSSTVEAGQDADFMSADYLGAVSATLRAGADDSLPVPVPRLGTTAVPLTTGDIRGLD
jgi:hypothetical protein